jgi:hypothetical protein
MSQWTDFGGLVDMNFEAFKQVIADGGWIIFFIYFLYKEVWPLITNKLIPASMKSIEAQRLQRVSELEDERLFRRELEIERAKTLETISKAIQDLSVSMAQTNERIASLLANQQLIIAQQNATFGVLTDAIGDMKEAAAGRRKGDAPYIPE